MVKVALDAAKVQAGAVVNSTPSDTTPQPEMLLHATPLPTLPTSLAVMVAHTTPNKAKLQAALTRVHDKANYRQVFAKSPASTGTLPGSLHRAQILAKTSSNTSLFLRALPTEQDFQFTNKQFIVMLNQYMSTITSSHLAISSLDVHCSCNSLTPSSPYRNCCDLQHLHNCRQESSFNTRHTALQRTVAAAVTAAGLTPELERPAAPHVNTASDTRLASKRFDVTIPSTETHSKMLHTDITVASYTTKQHFAAASCVPLVNARKASDGKIAKFRGLFDLENEAFLPLAFESSGAIHKNVWRLISQLGSHSGDQAPLQANWTTPTFSSYWMMRLSCILWLETATSLLRLCAAAKRRSKSDGELVTSS